MKEEKADYLASGANDDDGGDCSSSGNHGCEGEESKGRVEFSRFRMKESNEGIMFDLARWPSNSSS